VFVDKSADFYSDNAIVGIGHVFSASLAKRFMLGSSHTFYYFDGKVRFVNRYMTTSPRSLNVPPAMVLTLARQAWKGAAESDVQF